MAGSRRSRSDASDWKTAERAVRDNAAALRSLTTHTELYGWAKDNKLATRRLFPPFKTELRKQLHIDYEQLREQAIADRYAELTAAAAEAPVIELCCAGDAEVHTFAVCNLEGGDPWYGDFHEEDPIYKEGEQITADLSAAGKAVYLAGQAREYAGLEAINLTLTTSNHELDIERLRKDAVRHRVLVTLDVAADNPALALCRDLPGYRGWREVSLTDLIEPGDDTEPATTVEEGPIHVTVD